MPADITQIVTPAMSLPAWLRQLASRLENEAREGNQTESLVVITTSDEGRVSCFGIGDIDDDVVLSRLALCQTSMVLGVIGVIDNINTPEQGQIPAEA